MNVIAILLVSQISSKIDVAIILKLKSINSVEIQKKLWLIKNIVMVLHVLIKNIIIILIELHVIFRDNIVI